LDNYVYLIYNIKEYKYQIQDRIYSTEDTVC